MKYKFLVSIILLCLFSCMVKRNFYAYHTGDVVFYNLDTGTVLGLEVSPDGRPMYLVHPWNTSWRVHAEEGFLKHK
jgi:hypothetical protein